MSPQAGPSNTTNPTPNPTNTQTLTSLITSSLSNQASTTPNSPGPARKIYPTDDNIVTLLQARSRLELPCTRISGSGSSYVLVNPLRTLGCMSEESRKGYSRDIEDVRSGSTGRREEGLQPSVYELAGRSWMLMMRKRESQSVIFHGLSGSGKSTASRQFTNQILSLSSTTKAQKRLSDQISSLQTILESFGNSKSPLNPSASQHSKLLELHFSSLGEIIGAKVLAFGLNKSRVGNKLYHEERSFHVFYQLLAGASPDERDSLNMDEPSGYALLASSGTYRLPGGPYGDDAAQLGELRVAMANLGFKPKHVRSIFGLLISILQLSNISFNDDKSLGFGSLGMTSSEEKASIFERSRNTLIEVSANLGVSPEDLEAVLVNRTKWVSRDLCSMFLDAGGASTQRDSLMRDLYSILWIFVVELANKRLAPAGEDAAPELVINQLDIPGYTSRTTTAEPGSRPTSILSYGPLVHASGENGFDEFAINYMNEVVESYITKRRFEDFSVDSHGMIEDGLKIPQVITMDNSACMELLRGGSYSTKQLGGLISLICSASDELKGEERNDIKGQKLLGGITSGYSRHSGLVIAPVTSATAKHTFGINHFAGTVNYDSTDFVDKNSDVFDKQLVDLLRSSSDPFISKLVSGPGLATEGHPLDANITVEAQVTSTPLRILTDIVNPRGGKPGSTPTGEWPIDITMPQPVLYQLDGVLSTVLSQMDKTRLWTVLCIRPNDSGHPNSFDKRRVKSQVRSLLIPDLVNRLQVDYIADYTFAEFCTRQGMNSGIPLENVERFADLRGWVRGSDYTIGNSRIWLTWDSWREAEDVIRSKEEPRRSRGSGEDTLAEYDLDEGDDRGGNKKKNRYSMMGLGNGRPRSGGEVQGDSAEDLLLRRKDTQGDEELYSPNPVGYLGYQDSPDINGSAVWSNSDYPSKGVVGSGPVGDKSKDGKDRGIDEGDQDQDTMIVREKKHQATEIIATTRARRWWLRITWALTWWIPSFMLSKLGGMKRADIRMAWREKVAIFMMVIAFCGFILFYIIVFGILLCPDSDKAWNTSELATHQGESDYYAAIRGSVYDFTTFYKGQHSDIQAYPTTKDVMLEFAGQDLTNYFPPPLVVACPNLVTNQNAQLMRANFTPLVAYAVHTSGKLQTIPNTVLDQNDWYTNNLMPALQQYYKGSYVFTRNYVADAADTNSKQWAIYNNKVYDLSDYLYTKQYYASSSGTDLPNYSFLSNDISGLFQTSPGQDITTQMNAVLAKMNDSTAKDTITCLDNAFYVGQTDFRLTARCLVQNYLLLAFSIILMVTIGAKFFAALQLGSKRQPELLDKFVICQVPCYTEGEESLKRTIDSLAVLKYDDKRKLIFIICDGNIIGSGNNRPTPRIVLDILGVDAGLDPEPLLFKSIGEGSRQLNYAKVYSGLYEHEGHVVPYVVVVKVGKPTETSKPGNRGKRDSQVLLLHYLNRVHFDAPMSPLELEIYHQMRNVIGIDPTFYEYIFQVDADTTVEPDSLNRMIACTSDDSRIIGICGETKLENERESLTTMIQVYEYYISHHLTKAFESLFGSVTCLPGCFSVYRIRTADKGRPVIISSIVIDEYAEPNVDTLHKKNLFSLGEDRYLTTLMMKHFPTFKMKFTPDAIAHTVAPSRWNVLLSQRRRWINSTVHNLVELLWLPEMCGFCFFSMRFIVFIDLLGTIMLPATCGYLVYLIIVVSIGKSAIPIISLAMIAAVYGLQAIIFILKREFMLIGWMIVYILAFPVYSFFLPLYSFWSMDDFSWGNTRKVVGEGNQKTVVYEDDEPFHDSMIPYRNFKEYEANAWETASVHSEKSHATSYASAPRTNRSNPLAQSHGSRAPSMYFAGGPPEMPAGGDYWRDSSPLGPMHSSRNLRASPSQPALHHAPSNPYFQPTNRIQSMAGLSMWGGGSAYDGSTPNAASGFVQPMQPMMTGMSGSTPLHNPFDSPAGIPHQPSFYGVYGMGAPRGSVMTNLGAFNAPQQPGLQNRASSYSLASHPLATGGAVEGPRSSQDTNPSDEKILDTLRKYLSTQDLMTVTKRQTREAIYGLFPNVDLQARAGWINSNIDKILSDM